MSTNLLVFVHPGSLCGSWHSTPGFNEDQLEELLEEVHSHDGPKVSINGNFMDELIDYRDVGRAYDECETSYEADGDEDELESAAAEIAEDFDLKGADSVLVTGAWADPTHGCVTTVAKWLQAHTTALVTISPHSPKYDEAEGEGVLVRIC